MKEQSRLSVKMKILEVLRKQPLTSREMAVIPRLKRSYVVACALLDLQNERKIRCDPQTYKWSLV